MQIKGAISNKINRGQHITIEQRLTVAAVLSSGGWAASSPDWKFEEFN